MDSEKEIIKKQMLKELEEKLDKVLESPAVTFSDIENIVAKFQREMGHEVTEKMLALKKTQYKENSGRHVRDAK